MFFQVFVNLQIVKYINIIFKRIYIVSTTPLKQRFIIIVICLYDFHEKNFKK